MDGEKRNGVSIPYRVHAIVSERIEKIQRNPVLQVSIPYRVHAIQCHF